MNSYTLNLDLKKQRSDRFPEFSLCFHLAVAHFPILFLRRVRLSPAIRCCFWRFRAMLVSQNILQHQQEKSFQSYLGRLWNMVTFFHEKKNAFPPSFGKIGVKNCQSMKIPLQVTHTIHILTIHSIYLDNDIFRYISISASNFNCKSEQLPRRWSTRLLGSCRPNSQECSPFEENPRYSKVKDNIYIYNYLVVLTILKNMSMGRIIPYILEK